MLNRINIASGSDVLVSAGMPDGHWQTEDQVYIRDIKGIEPVTATINTTRSGTIIGESFNGVTYPSREMVVTFGVLPKHRWRAEDVLNNLYGYVGSQVRVRLATNNPDTRYVDGYIKSVIPTMFSAEPLLMVTITCPRPFFNENSQTIIRNSNEDFTLPAFYTQVPIGILLRYRPNSQITTFVFADSDGQEIRWTGAMGTGNECVVNTQTGRKSIIVHNSAGTHNSISGLDGTKFEFNIQGNGKSYRLRSSNQNVETNAVTLTLIPQWQAGF